MTVVNVIPRSIATKESHKEEIASLLLAKTLCGSPIKTFGNESDNGFD